MAPAAAVEQPKQVPAAPAAQTPAQLPQESVPTAPQAPAESVQTQEVKKPALAKAKAKAKAKKHVTEESAAESAPSAAPEVQPKQAAETVATAVKSAIAFIASYPIFADALYGREIGGKDQYRDQNPLRRPHHALCQRGQGNYPADDLPSRKKSDAVCSATVRQAQRDKQKDEG